MTLGRHRLLLEPKIDKSGAAIPIQGEPCDLPVADVENVCPLCLQLLHFQPTRLALSAMPHEHKHTVAVNLAVLVRLDAIALPGAQEVTPSLRHRTQSLQVTSIR